MVFLADIMPIPPLPDYAELDCISNFSFLYGASHPQELVCRAAQLGYRALALADECSLAGVVRAHLEARKHALKLIIGSRFQLDAATEHKLHVIVLVCNTQGYANLAEMITLARTRSTAKGHYALSLQDLIQPPKGLEHLQYLPGCLLIFKPVYGMDAVSLQQQTALLHQAFKERLWLGLTLHHREDDAQHSDTVFSVSHALKVPVTAAAAVHMHSRSRQPLHDTLAAIRLHRPVSLCGYALSPNAEPHLRSRLRLMQIYPQQTLQETLHISQLCRFGLDELQYQYPQEVVPAGSDPAQYLREQSYAGAHRRYPKGIPASVQAQLESELAIIAGLQYEPYFLTVYDIVQFARSQGILCQGRGSAANSAVCYCLGITEVDPKNANTLFARFISVERNEPPDIDVDFEHQRREEVIQYIYRKYGRKNAALTCVVVTYRSRSALRDTGKALGVDVQLIDKITRSCRHWANKNELMLQMAEQGLSTASRLTQLWAELALTLRGFPRHLSQHPGGFVITNHNLARLVPIENAAMPGRSVIQWDKDDLDAMGIMKVDVLALGMLSALKRMLALYTLRHNQPFALQDIGHDEATFAMMRQADTMGVFQIESRAQMSMLPRLRPRTYYDLVIQLAIVRPGPIQGGMVHPYLRRRKGEEAISYPSEDIKKILERTLGVPIFQEQAMQIAITAGGFSPGEADQLRRSMAAWRRKGGIDAFHAKLINGMIAKGYDEHYAQSIFEQLQGFGEYGFPESHSASFAQLAYFSAWFKCHEPEAFLVALLNAQPMGFYTPSQLVQDAQRHQVKVLPVDVTTSQWEAHLVLATGKTCRPAVRLGLNQIKGMSRPAALRIEAARQQSPYSSLHDLALRAALDRHDLERLASADALLLLSGHRRQAYWQAANPPLKGLLREAPIQENGPPLLHTPSVGNEVIIDYQSTGLSLRRHPLALLRKLPQLARFASAQQLASYPDRRLARACGLVTVRQRPQTASGVVFVSLEDETGTINIIVRPQLAERQRITLHQSRLMGVYGVWQRHQGVCHLMANRLVDLSVLLGPLPTQVRNFH